MSDVALSRELDLGRVIQETFRVLGRRLVPFLALALVLAGLPVALSQYVNFGMRAPGSFQFGWQYFASIGITLLASLLLQAAVIHGAVSDLNGRPVNIGGALAAALGSLLPLIGVGLLEYVGLLLGFVFLLVPGLMLLTAWAVLVPALVVEKTGVIGAFRRSAELTRNNRLRIFGLLLVLFVALLIVEAVSGVMSNSFRVGAGQAPSLVVTYLVTPVLTAVNALLGAVGAAVLYVELRQVREGVGPDGLASIFD